MGRSATIIFLAFGCWSAKAVENNCTRDPQGVKITDVPYQVGIEGSSYRCGGSIVGQKFVLTAAHCVHGVDLTKETISIRTKSPIKKEGGTTISVKNIIIHPKYNKSESFDFDIAILELDDSINLDEKSQISNLPDKEPSAGENAKMTGWGHPKPGSTRPIVQLETFDAVVTDRKVCQTAIEKISDRVTPRVFCVLTSKGNSCPRISGSAVTVNKVQVGIVSWGVVRSCDGEAPIGAVNLAHPDIKKFITDNINKN